MCLYAPSQSSIHERYQAKSSHHVLHPRNFVRLTKKGPSRRDCFIDLQMTTSYEYKRAVPPQPTHVRLGGGEGGGDHSCNLHSKRRKSRHGTWVLQQIVERMRERTAATPLRPPKAMHHGLAQSRARLFGGRHVIGICKLCLLSLFLSLLSTLYLSISPLPPLPLHSRTLSNLKTQSACFCGVVIRRCP